MKFDKKKYDNNYIKENKDRINFVMPKGRKEEIQNAANEANMSAAAWINEAIVEKMEKKPCASGAFDFCASIPDLEAYARSVGLTPEEYIKIAVAEKMERQDAEYKEEVTREAIEE